MESKLVIFNLLLCMLGGYLCICRMKSTSHQTKPVIIARYVMWFALLVASGLSWLYGVPANVFQILLGLGVVADLMLGFKAWQRGAPKYTLRT